MLWYTNSHATLKYCCNTCSIFRNNLVNLLNCPFIIKLVFFCFINLESSVLSLVTIICSGSWEWTNICLISLSWVQTSWMKHLTSLWMPSTTFSSNNSTVVNAYDLVFLYLWILLIYSLFVYNRVCFNYFLILLFAFSIIKYLLFLILIIHPWGLWCQIHIERCSGAKLTIHMSALLIWIACLKGLGHLFHGI